MKMYKIFLDQLNNNNSPRAVSWVDNASGLYSYKEIEFGYDKR